MKGTKKMENNQHFRIIIKKNHNEDFARPVVWLITFLEVFSFSLYTSFFCWKIFLNTKNSSLIYVLCWKPHFLVNVQTIFCWRIHVMISYTVGFFFLLFLFMKGKFLFKEFLFFFFYWIINDYVGIIKLLFYRNFMLL